MSRRTVNFVFSLRKNIISCRYISASTHYFVYYFVYVIRRVLQNDTARDRKGGAQQSWKHNSFTTRWQSYDDLFSFYWRVLLIAFVLTEQNLWNFAMVFQRFIPHPDLSRAKNFHRNASPTSKQNTLPFLWGHNKVITSKPPLIFEFTTDWVLCFAGTSNGCLTMLGLIRHWSWWADAARSVSVAITKFFNSRLLTNRREIMTPAASIQAVRTTTTVTLTLTPNRIPYLGYEVTTDSSLRSTNSEPPLSLEVTSD